VRDRLTGVFNREYLNDRLFAEVSRERRESREVVVLMIGVDGLEEVNALFGHLAGDRALCAIAARIQRVLRVEDVLARYGGDEFVVVAVGNEGAGTWQLADRIRRAVEGLQMSARGQQVRITASIGVASLSEVDASDGPVAALLASADARMCGAKASGRNRVCSIAPPPEPSAKLHSGTRPRTDGAGQIDATAPRARVAAKGH